MVYATDTDVTRSVGLLVVRSPPLPWLVVGYLPFGCAVTTFPVTRCAGCCPLPTVLHYPTVPRLRCSTHLVHVTGCLFAGHHVPYALPCGYTHDVTFTPHSTRWVYVVLQRHTTTPATPHFTFIRVGSTVTRFDPTTRYRAGLPAVAGTFGYIAPFTVGHYRLPLLVTPVLLFYTLPYFVHLVYTLPTRLVTYRFGSPHFVPPHSTAARCSLAFGYRIPLGYILALLRTFPGLPPHAVPHRFPRCWTARLCDGCLRFIYSLRLPSLRLHLPAHFAFAFAFTRYRTPQRTFILRLVLRYTRDRTPHTTLLHWFIAVCRLRTFPHRFTHIWLHFSCSGYGCPVRYRTTHRTIALPFPIYAVVIATLPHVVYFTVLYV